MKKIDELDELDKQFEKYFFHRPTIIARAPGRVNLIGEHTDYNDGWVMPMAIDCRLLLAARPREDKLVKIIALDQQHGETEFSLSSALTPLKKDHWSNYLRGMAMLFYRRGNQFPGLDIIVSGNIPMGAGLSSSAALLIAAGLLFQAAGDFSISRIELAKLAQQAEHEFCGVKSGIMDQFVIALAARDHALLLDCRSLEYQQIPLPKDVAIIICNTMKSRDLHASEYNSRRSDCEAAVALLSSALARPLNSLRELSSAELSTVLAKLPEKLARRAQHVVGENERVLSAVEAARTDDVKALGVLLDQSHESLRDLYQVSSRELDLMCEIARRQTGVLGARLTGAGFGGCTVNLVAAGYAETIIAAIADEYQQATNLVPQIYLAKAQNGAEIVRKD